MRFWTETLSAASVRGVTVPVGSQAVAHLETLDGIGKRVVIGAGRPVGSEIAADDQALAQEFVMRSQLRRPQILRRTE